jgi:hypothetical protein
VPSPSSDAKIIMAALNQFLELRAQEVQYGRDVSYIDGHISRLTEKLPDAKGWKRG